ncbi:MAG: hypothetical protein AMJ61_02805 [Desulfobacterales bacterium SG8_35_2]|nr:MAG: hypothetical protein AMJ61_02805 [Desulfobacterales bacterium SG8_35_2]
MDLKKSLLRYKPGVSIRTHLFLAALIWSLVGFFLLSNGFVFIFLHGPLWYAVVGLVLGTIKTFFILDRVARKNIKRIKEFDDKVCVGSVYSWKTWILVAAMITLGRFLRMTVLPAEAVGLIYTAVGWALMLASRLMWLEWKRTP